MPIRIPLALILGAVAVATAACAAPPPAPIPTTITASPAAQMTNTPTALSAPSPPPSPSPAVAAPLPAPSPPPSPSPSPPPSSSPSPAAIQQPPSGQVPPKTLRGVLLERGTGKPLPGSYTVIVGWGSGGPTSGSLNRVFISGGAMDGPLVVQDSGAFSIDGVDFPLYVSSSNMISKAEPSQALMLWIRRAAGQPFVAVEAEGGTPVEFTMSEAAGRDLGRVFLAP
jgi:hypothetical protein